MSKNHQGSTLRVWLIGVAIIGAAALTRILPHPHNFTPMAALALFGGAHFRDKFRAFLVPLAAMLLSDVVLYLARYPSYVGEAVSTALVVYGSLALIAGIGLWLQNRRTVVNVAGACLVSSLLFFLITNFAVWVKSGMYPLTAGGLISCYVAAIPFFQNQLAADVLFTAVLFGGFALIEGRVPQLRERHELASG
ncbi:MAG: hypothetical protein GXP27_12770 [Planctomycetes bacterium]|nr:hypothetical protein [Planctomycetota bacterium]